MDIQLQRKLEGLLRLVDIPLSMLAENIEFSWSPCIFTIEALPQRLLVTGNVKARNQDVLEHVLRYCYPQITQGVAQRACLVDDLLILGCDLPMEKDEHFWFQLISWQHKVLSAYAGRK